MISYSLVPGLYVLYDYSKALQFHGKLIPNKFTITEAGRTVVEAETADAPGGTVQVVVLHGMQSPAAQLADVELLASSDAALNEPALAIASKWVGGMMGQEPEPGATPQSHEVLMTIQYSTAQH